METQPAEGDEAPLNQRVTAGWGPRGMGADAGARLFLARMPSRPPHHKQEPELVVHLVTDAMALVLKDICRLAPLLHRTRARARGHTGRQKGVGRQRGCGTSTGGNQKPDE